MGQSSYSTTNSAITRGNHFHTRKIERFSVIKGKAKIQLRKYLTDEIISFETMEIHQVMLICTNLVYTQYYQYWRKKNY